MTAPDCDVTDCGIKVYAHGWCQKHYARWYSRGGDPSVRLFDLTSAADRFWAKVQKTDTCWLWIGRIADTGYGTTWADGRTTYAHRWVYEATTAPIPDGLVIDHLCRVRHCVNPAHLEPVTQAENVRRWVATITHCPQGHEYTEANSRYSSRGHRTCRACQRDRQRARRARLVGAR